jgi:SAM-dependent methyltransferase
MDGGRPETTAWLETALGRRCLTAEQRLVRRALERVFGEQLLQIGVWGEPDSFIRYARTQHRAVVDWRPDTGADLICDTSLLAIASDTVDAVVLPHALELTDSPHSLLREVDRILRPDGHIVIFGFVAGGVWGLRRLFSAEGYPPGHQHVIRDRRLRDWLELLSFDVASPQRYCHALPFESFRRFAPRRRELWAQRWLPMLAGGYLIRAQKRVRMLTPIRPRWRERRLKVVGGLVEPTTRVPHSRPPK